MKSSSNILKSNSRFLSQLTSMQSPSSSSNRSQISKSSKKLNHSNLPRLPIPSLEQSVKLYLNSIIPFLIQSTGSEFKSEFKRRQIWADELIAPGSLGQRLQNRLIDIDRKSLNNWLNDNYWIKLAYHSNRLALPINSNWWILLKPDKDIPSNLIQSINQINNFTDWQLRRAATLVYRFLKFKNLLDCQEIIQDSSRAARWQRHWILDSLYGITRIPNKPNDHLNVINPNSRHIIVIARDHFYSLDVIKPDLSLFSSKQIEAGLWSIINHLNLQSTPPQLGCLTGLNRDRWVEGRELLLNIDPIINRQSLSTIEDGLFTLCLDNFTRSGGIKGHIQTASSNLNGSNRWFDKSFSFIVENNSRASVLGEHSPLDALIPAIITDFVLAEGVGPGLCDPSIKSANIGQNYIPWKKLEFIVNDQILKLIQEAKLTIESISNDSDPHMLWFDHYGTDYIKYYANHSPDAYIQMAIQLAWYRQMGNVVSTYETALTRLFKHGRTDVIRTLSCESYAWVKSMDNKNENCHTIYNLFLQAISAHNRYTKQASLGKAFERHFLGLRLQHRPEEDGDLPNLFTDPIFSESSQWQLSTSGINAGERFLGTGFGCFGRGYGINYLVGPHVIKFGIETKHSDPRTCSIEFAKFISNALDDIKILCEEATGKRPSQSRI